MRDLASKYIVIEGPIGVGKTSLSNKLALEWDADLILENVDDNPFLSKFYKNQREVSFQTQLYFLLTRTTIFTIKSNSQANYKQPRKIDIDWY